MILHDFECTRCFKIFEALVRSDERETACECNYSAVRIMSAPKTFHEIVPTTLTSKKRKAGYQHSHADRPKTPGKIQVSVL
jgi:DNA-directed RNA polymerase subunit RPC12/RpoP